MSRSRALPAGTLVLDSEGLSKGARRSPDVGEWLAVARAREMKVLTSAATVVEATNPRINRPALKWLLSLIHVEDVSEPVADRASVLLKEAGLHGHAHAIDAMLCATALAAERPVTILTSDPDDIAALCGKEATVIKV